MIYRTSIKLSIIFSAIFLSLSLCSNVLSSCLLVQTASFRTDEQAEKHFQNVEQVLNTLPSKQAVDLILAKYPPHFTVRIGCFDNRKNMEYYLAALRQHWPGAMMIEKPDQWLFRDNALVQEKSFVNSAALLLNNDPKKKERSKTKNSFVAPPIKTKITKKQEPTRIVRKIDYLLLFFIAITFGLSLYLSVRLYSKRSRVVGVWRSIG